MGFFFKSRKKYNGDVDAKLNKEFGIRTRENPYFPGILYYLQQIDSAWAARMNEDEAAMMIAVCYCCGLAKVDIVAAADLEVKILTSMAFDVDHGIISDHWALKFKRELEDAGEEYIKSLKK